MPVGLLVLQRVDVLREEDLARIEEPNVFLVDDVAFIHPEHGFAIGQELERRGVRKRYYLETRCDVLLRHPEVFAYWKRLGLEYMFLGVEALDEEALKLHRKRVTPSENLRALEVARSLDIMVAVNIIADPDWDERRFAIVREWALSRPEIVHLTVNTPYPGTESWFTESRRLASLDYRLFDVQHAVLPTRLPLRRFYEELVRTQAVINKKHLGWAALREVAGIAGRLLLRGQTNFVRSLWKFSRVYSADRQFGDHARPVRYAMRPPAVQLARPKASDLFVHRAPPRTMTPHAMRAPLFPAGSVRMSSGPPCTTRALPLALNREVGPALRVTREFVTSRWPWPVSSTVMLGRSPACGPFRFSRPCWALVGLK